MFIKKDANLIVDYINCHLPKELAEDPDIIIAGGFALNAFLVNEALAGVSNEMASLLKKSFLLHPVMKFSDLDLWILKDSKSGFAPLFEHVKGGQAAPGRKKERHPFEDGVKVVDQKWATSKWSDWANTYTVTSKPAIPVKKVPIQCIVKPQNSPEDLLSSFDLGVCSVAIHRGEFIVHQSLIDSIKSKELLYNNGKSLKYKSLGSRVFQSLRFFKYIDKTGFDFSEDVYKDVLATMSDANTFWIEAKKQGALNQYGGMTNGVKVKITTTNDYEQEVVTKESIRSMIQQLALKFESMQKMKHWDITHALFFQDSSLFSIKGIIEKNTLGAEKSSQSKLDTFLDNLL